MTPAAAIARLPAGRWAVGISGGADSVALLRLLANRGDCTLVVAHLNHQLREAESDGDAAFVRALGHQLGLAVEETTLISPLPLREGVGGGVSSVGRSTGSRNPSPHPLPQGEGERNPSARYRAARLAFFAEVVARHQLDGVVLAHHADDQAETVLLQLGRGRGLPFLGGMIERQMMNRFSVARVFNPCLVSKDAETRVENPCHENAALLVWRPLLTISRPELRNYLAAIDQPWREDSSNVSPAYGRNVLRGWLADRPALTPMLLQLAEASRRWHRHLDAAAPVLPERFATEALRVPLPLAAHAARRWLVARGCPPDRVSPAVCGRLIDQATNVAAAPRQHYPGGLLVRRRQKHVDVVARPAVQSVEIYG